MNLNLISSNDLIAELLNRFDCGVISLLQIKNKISGELSTISCWKGDTFTCVGLNEDTKIKMLNKFDRTQDSYKFN